MAEKTWQEEVREFRALMRRKPGHLVWRTLIQQTCLPLIDGFHKEQRFDAGGIPLNEVLRDIRGVTGYQLARLLARMPLMNRYEWQAFAIVPRSKGLNYE